MGIFAGSRPLLNPLHLGCIDGCRHVDLSEQFIAHILGTLFHGQSKVLYSQLDVAGELLACCLKPKVVFAEGVTEFNQVALVELPLVSEG